MAATVVTDPARPTRVDASPSGTVSAATADRLVDVGVVAAAISSAVGGSECRWRSVSRTQPMSTERAASTVRVAEHELGRAAADVDDEVAAPATLRRQRVAASRRGTTARLLVAGDDLGRRRRARRAPPSTKSSRLAASRARRGARRTGPCAAPSTRMRCRHSRARPSGCARAPRRRAGRCGRRPRRAARSPSRASRSVERAVGVDVGDEQPDRVGAAVDRGDAGHSSTCTHGPSAHHSGSSARASSPSGLTPGPAASECATSTCRHLTRSACRRR